MAYTLTQQLESGMNNKGITTTKDIDDTPTGKTQQEINSNVTQGNVLKGGSWVSPTKTYTLDFGSSSDVIQDINVTGGTMTIDRVVPHNVSLVYVSYGSVLRAPVELSSPISLSVPDGTRMVWEIVRTNEGEPACLGVRYNIA